MSGFGLHFTSSTEIPSNPPPTVDVTLTNATAAENIYTATLALPDFPPGEYNCPNDDGVRYEIAFLSGQSVAVSATLSPTGCGDVTISGSATRRVLDEGYWATLARNLGIAEATIYPPPGP